MRVRLAFTLIELLIAVGIITILAAIALPNFIEAQTRAKVARAESDLRTLASAIQMYQIDWNTPPPGTDDPAQLNRITTPIEYLTASPRDIFFRGESSDPYHHFHGPGYRFWILTFMRENGNRWGGAILDRHMRRGDRWLLCSRGPDGEEVVVSTGIVEYDPTNGTLSQGDFYLWGR
jgi:prepilin-type N-terminal cleavage/methylation domain-containing protein